MRLNSPQVKKGARRIISTNLGLRLGEDVLILVDETTRRVGDVLAIGARYYGVRATVMTVLKEDQPNYVGNRHFPLPMARAIDSAQAIVSALSDIPEGTGFRRYVLSQSRQMKTKVALMPGVTLDMIAELADLDYGLLQSSCDNLHHPFLFGAEASVTTWDKKAKPHKLQMKLGSWNQPPTISSGIVHSQSFDNIPSGEVYIAPFKGSANGEIVINGSVTGYVFREKDEIKLTFSDGKLVKIVPIEHPAAAILGKAIKNARSNGDKEPDFLAELGVGVSPGITELTGNSLKDEKAYRTAHIAIGLNEPFGGNVEANYIHEDLVFCGATITFDGKSVIEKGEISVKDLDWLQSYKHVVPGSNYTRQHLKINISETDAVVKSGDILHRVYYNGTDARTTVQVGNRETASLATKVYENLPDTGDISLERLSKTTQISEDILRPVLYIMGEFYNLLWVSG